MIRWTARHPIIPLALAGIIVCLGAASVWRMPLAFLQGSEKSSVEVYLWASGEPGREVLLDRLVRPLERRLSSDPGVAHYESWVLENFARTGVELKPGEDVEEAAGRLREAVSSILAAGPKGSRGRVWRARSYGEFPGLIVQLTGVERETVEKDLLPALRRTQGVQEATLYPPWSREVHLAPVIPEASVRNAVRERIREGGARRVLGRAEEGMVVSPPAPSSLEELLAMPVAAGGARGRLSELVRAAYWRPPSTYRIRVNAAEGLYVFVRDDPTAPRRTGLAAARRLVETWVRARPGAACTVVRDTWGDVLGSLSRLAVGAHAGLLLMALALRLAVRARRAAALLAAAVPVALVLSLVLLAAAGVGLDVVVLSGLAIGVGLLAPAGVVVLDLMASLRGEPVGRAAEAAGMALRPLVLGVLSLAAVLLPLSVGLVEELAVFRPAVMPLLACAAAALLVALAVLPGAAAAAGLPPRLDRPGVLARAVKASVRDPLVVILGLLALSVSIFFLLGGQLKAGDSIKGGDLRWATIEFTQPPGANPEAFDEASRDLEAKIASIPGIKQVVAQLDLARGEAWLNLELQRGHTAGRARAVVLDRVYWKMKYEARFKWKLSRETVAMFREGLGYESDLQLLGARVRGEELGAVDDSADRVVAVAGQQPEKWPLERRVLLDPRTPDTDLAGRFGEEEAQRPIEMVLDGQAVKVTVEEHGRPAGDKPLPLAEWLETPQGAGGIPAQFARAGVVKEKSWPARKDGAFERDITLRIASRPSASKAVKAQNRAALYAKLRGLPLPAGVTLSLDDLKVKEPRPPWLVPLLLALAALYLVLGVGFESALAPLRVMVATLPYMAGGVLSAWIFQAGVNEAFVLGFLLLPGVAAGAAALLEDRYLRLRRLRTKRPQAAVRAALERGPVALLTSALVALAILPLWFAGVDQVGKPLVAVLGGGLLLGTPVLFLLLPALQAAGARRPAREPVVWKGGGGDEVALRSLSKTYRGGVRALTSVCSSLEPGLVGLLGPNGAGKTTLLRCFVGTLRADRGDVWVNGVPRRDDPEGFRSLVGYLPQAQEAPRRLESLKWLVTWAAEMGLPDPRAAAEGVLAAVGVSDLADRRLGELSGGQRRRVCIARALLGDPRILVVDEPTTGLDPEARVMVRNQLAQLAAGRLVILSTHIAEDVAVTCRRVIVLAEGRILYDGVTEDLLERARGKVRARLIGDEQLRIFQMTHRIVSRVREMDGIRVRYLTLDPLRDRGETVDPSLEEAYLALVEGV